ncbi:MAG: nucleotidyl transferase AbiEii/AbiGii toxin family protein [Burkholderiales bacterium]
MPTELDVLRDVCMRLESVGIAYMLTGSMALNYYAQPRMTRDVDLVIDIGLDTREKFSEVFTADYYVPHESIIAAIQAPGMFNLVHMESVVKVDFVVRKDDSYRETEFSRRKRVSFGGFECWIVSREDLILSKLAWALDSRSDFQLRDVRSLLQGEADWDYLRKWAPYLHVESLLSECKDERH